MQTRRAFIPNGEPIADSRFKNGLNFNDVDVLDERLGSTPVVDLVGGIPDFSSRRVKIITV